MFPGGDIRSILNRNIFTYSVPEDFGKREYEEKAEKIVKWSEKFGISKIKAGWWGGNILGSDYLDPELSRKIQEIFGNYKRKM